MNLVHDPWIPVVDLHGSVGFGSPVDVLVGRCRTHRVDSPRPEFRGAIYQFLIGLLQTTFPPQTIDDWAKLWDEPPSGLELATAFAPVERAFDLYSDSGPAFMQDFGLPEKASVARIDSLLPTTPGDNAIKKNTDIFVKRGFADSLCESCTACALLVRNLNGVAAGTGYRVGIRGGGPLTTIPLANEPPHGIWSEVWLSVLPLDSGNTENATTYDADVFPWLGPTRVSVGDATTHPQDVHPLQAYWAMPQRIRLEPPTGEGDCDLCGTHGPTFTAHRITNYGTSYGPTWIHPLSPYRVQPPTKGQPAVVIAGKGKQGGYSYVDWLGLTIGAGSDAHAAPAVASVTATKMFAVGGLGDMRLWCFGYDAENAKVRRWYDQSVPLLQLPPRSRVHFSQEAQVLIDAATNAAFLLERHVKAAWFETPKKSTGETGHIRMALYSATEDDFYSIVHHLRRAVDKEAGDDKTDIEQVRNTWRSVLVTAAEELFDFYALQETDEVRNMSRIAKASHYLRLSLHGPKAELTKILGGSQ